VSPASVDRAKAESGEGAGALVLWAGVLVPPLVFLTNLLVSYAMAYWACSTGKRWALDVVTLVALAIVLYCGFTAWRLLGASAGGDVEGAHADDRNRFLALVGLLVSALFTVATLAFLVPRLVIGPCYP
jgi:hypothetical protein